MTLLTADLHCHTYRSKDSLLVPGRLLEIARQRGIDRLGITDHNCILGALEAARLDPERVIVGEEIRTAAGELLAYFMREEVPPGLTPQETIFRLREQGAFISIAHPFDGMRGGGWSEATLRDVLPLVDALEVFNSRTWSARPNQLASARAAEAGLLGTAGSDAHAACEIGRAVVRLPPFRDTESLRAALRSAEIRGRRSTPLVHLLSRYASWRKAAGWHSTMTPEP